MASVRSSIRLIISGVLVASVGIGIAYAASTQFGYPLWPTIGISLTILGIVSAYYLSNGEKTQIVQGDHVEKQKVYLGHPGFRDLLDDQDIATSLEQLRDLADKVENNTQYSLDNTKRNKSKNSPSEVGSFENYDVVLSTEVEADLRTLDEPTQRRIRTKICDVTYDFGIFSQIVNELTGTPFYILRIRPYRAILDIDAEEDTIYVLAIGHREDIYSQLESVHR